jgi:hypothetical protein
VGVFLQNLQADHIYFEYFAHFNGPPLVGVVARVFQIVAKILLDFLPVDFDPELLP